MLEDLKDPRLFLFQRYYLNEEIKRGIIKVASYSSKVTFDKLPVSCKSISTIKEFRSFLERDYMEVLRAFSVCFQPILREKVIAVLEQRDVKAPELILKKLLKWNILYSVEGKKINDTLKLRVPDRDWSGECVSEKGQYLGLLVLGFVLPTGQIYPVVPEWNWDKRIFTETGRNFKRVALYLLQAFNTVAVEGEEIGGWGYDREFNDALATSLSIQSLVQIKNNLPLAEFLGKEFVDELAIKTRLAVKWLWSAQNTKRNISRYAKTKFAEDVHKFAKKELKPDNGWGYEKGKPSQVVPTAMAIKTLVENPITKNDESLKLAISYLLDTQKEGQTYLEGAYTDKGSWGETKTAPAEVGESSLAMWSLMTAYHYPIEKNLRSKIKKAIEIGMDWLRKMQHTPKSTGQLVERTQVKTLLNTVTQLLGRRGYLPEDFGWSKSFLSSGTASDILHTGFALLALVKYYEFVQQTSDAYKILDKNMGAFLANEKVKNTLLRKEDVFLQSIYLISLCSVARKVGKGCKAKEHIFKLAEFISDYISEVDLDYNRFALPACLLAMSAYYDILQELWETK